MQNRDLDYDFGASSGGGSSRKSSGSQPSGSSGMSRSRSREDRVRNSSRGSSSDMSTHNEDLQRQQIEGNLGNERVRSRADD